MSAGFDPYRDWLQITSLERPVDFYTLLGVPRFLNDGKQISAAADQRLAILFPLTQGPYVAYAQPLFNEVANAKAALLQPAAKQAYDAELWRRTSLTSTPAAPPATSTAELLPPTAPPVAPPVVRRGTPATTPEAEPEVAAPWHSRTTVRIGLALAATTILVVGGLLVRGRLGSGETPPVDPTLAAAEMPEEPPAEPPPETPEPQPDVVVKQEGSGDVNCTASVARINGQAERQVVGTDTVIGGWSDVKTQLEWEFSIAKPDVFELQLIYSTEDDWAGANVTVQIDEERRTFETRASGGIGKFITDAKFIPIKKKGKHRLTVFATTAPGAEVLILKTVRLVPTKQSSTGP